MKRIIGIILFIVLVFLVYNYRNDIYEFYYDVFVPIEDKVTKLEKNDYYRDYNFSYAKNIEDFISS